MEEARKGQGNLDEEVALVKASAWAWYHHHQEKVPAAAEQQQHHLPYARKLGPIKPSRYKLEAAIMAPPSEEESYQQQAAEISLLDSYEIQRISRQLDVYIKSSHDQYYKTRSFFVATNSALESETINATTTDQKKFNKLKEKKQQYSNALIWSSVRVPVLCCSTKHDVVALEPSSPRSKMESPSRQQRPGNHHVMVVKAATCRPRG